MGSNRIAFDTADISTFYKFCYSMNASDNSRSHNDIIATKLKTVLIDNKLASSSLNFETPKNKTNLLIGPMIQSKGRGGGYTGLQLVFYLPNPTHLSNSVHVGLFCYFTTLFFSLFFFWGGGPNLL